jgi:hypothetical protein
VISMQLSKELHKREDGFLKSRRKVSDSFFLFFSNLN